MRWLLPWCKVSTNNLYISVGRRRILAPLAETWRNEVIATVRASAHASDVPGGDLRLVIRAYEPNRIRRDTDGLIKPTQDAIALAFGFDDARIREVVATRYPKGWSGPDNVAGPCLVVELTQWKDAA